MRLLWVTDSKISYYKARCILCVAYANSRISGITHSSSRSAIRRTTCKRVAENRFDTSSRGELLARRERGRGEKSRCSRPSYHLRTWLSFSFSRATVDNWVRTQEKLSLFFLRSLFLLLSRSHELFQSDTQQCTRMRDRRTHG